MRILVTGVAVYAGLCVLARVVSRKLIYPAPAPRAWTSGIELLRLRASDGADVHAAFIAPPAGARTIVFFHGNGEQIDDSVPLAHELARRGFGVALVEYRGYGPSARGAGPTQPTEEGLYLDAETVLDALASRGIAPQTVALWGTSLGSGVAAEMARRGRGASLVLVTPYTSVPAVAARVVPFLPARWCVPDRFDTLSKAEAIRVPTLVIHGDRDEVIPFAMGERVSRAIDGARFIRVDGGHHNDLFAREGTRLMDAIDAHARL
jgi:pimeloyl-ACP methyl ester carboxylesterase